MVTAAEEIQQHLDARVKAWDTIFARLDGEPEDDDPDADYDAQEQLDEFPLAVTQYKMVRIDLSTGGPGDWLEVLMYEGNIQHITYHFAPWFDHAEIDVTDNETVERFVNNFYLGDE